MLGVDVFWKVKIKTAIDYESTDGEIRYMYKAFKKTRVVRRYTEALALHTDAPKVHWEDNTNFISVFESKIVTPRVKHVDIPV